MDTSNTLIGAAIGGLFGVLLAVWQKYSAQAAVEVRPELAEVGFVSAALTQHGGDWLFYHYPAISMMVTTVLLAIAGALVFALD